MFNKMEESRSLASESPFLSNSPSCFWAQSRVLGTLHLCPREAGESWEKKLVLVEMWGWGWRRNMERTLNWAFTQTPPLHLKPRPSSSADFNMFFLHLVRDLVFLPPKRVWKVLTLRIQVLAYMVEHVFHPSA